jgi:hypothetical protein
LTDFLQNKKRPAAILSGGENFVRFNEINEVMRNPALLGGQDFGRADIEVAINLSGIANENFAAKALGEPNPQSRLPGSGWAEDDDEARGWIGDGHREKCE